MHRVGTPRRPACAGSARASHVTGRFLLIGMRPLILLAVCDASLKARTLNHLPCRTSVVAC